jgi:hypothetical protein
MTTQGMTLAPKISPFLQEGLGGGQANVHITFDIVSGDVTVKGEKSQDQPLHLPCDITTYSVGGVWNYTATITGPTGTLSDSGLAQGGWALVQGNATYIQEAFASSAGGVVVRTDPNFATNPVSTSHTIIAFVEDIQFRPIPNVTVYFTVEGSVNTTGTCITNSSGYCSFTYSGPTQPGADLITAFADVNGNGQQDLTEFEDDATKAWVFSTPPAGSVTGGGQAGVEPASVITFGFNARNDPTVSGNCTVIDPSTDPRTIIKCSTVTNVTVIPSPTGGGTAHIDATGTINGIQTNIQIDVTDVSEPNRGADQFRISTTSGYTAGGAVTQGNIQVHR